MAQWAYLLTVSRRPRITVVSESWRLSHGFSVSNQTPFLSKKESSVMADNPITFSSLTEFNNKGDVAHGIQAWNHLTTLSEKNWKITCPLKGHISMPFSFYFIHLPDIY